LLTAEMALYHVSKGKTVLTRLNELYAQFGYFEEKTISTYFRGQSGAKVMAQLMEDLRDKPPKSLGGMKVERLRDVKTGTTKKMPQGTPVEDIDLPSSNVLQFFLEDGTIVSARPSGTEPKIKFYISVPSAPGTPLKEATADVAKRLKAIDDDIQSWIPEE
jgi:phosphoglucomutase